MILYEIRNTVNNSIYVGITRSKLSVRWGAHKCAAKRGVKSILYDAIRSFGIENFSIHIISTFDEEADLLQGEKDLISHYRYLQRSMNILDGGEAYFPIKDKESWRKQLSLQRQGKKPALGMKHTEENKKLFSQYGKARWDKYGRYPDDIINLSFKKAHNEFGISKTHYYRLKKQAGKTDAS